ncbi:benzoyl-CoA 2,3-epoxidase subunit BoxA [Pseudopelagicola sp. nBUS_20]|uniref:benzoyl-CoA 2,3-epoxidase subunit BoxA n=1 Tax=Pseudopelagicola sp. nBUS_20 TaxID=3395317 RepID=UPI003EBBB632
MTQALKQHLIDPEICIRCHTCEMTCPIGAIQHNDDNVVVDPDACNFCMDCIPVCPTGSIDEWRVVAQHYSLDDQFGWEELPEQEAINTLSSDAGAEAMDPVVVALLNEAHKGAGGKSRAPKSAAKPAINMYTIKAPATATVQGNFRLTAEGSDTDTRHIILNFEGQTFPVLEGQTIGIIPPGSNTAGNANLPRLYSVSSPRDGERPNFGNVSLTVKRETHGLASNFICDLQAGDTVQVTGPFGSTFLLPEDPDARLLMICTGTGSAPMRAFTMRRERIVGKKPGGMTMIFGARAPEELPYFGPLKKLPVDLLQTHMVFSRLPGTPKEYVQDRMMVERKSIAELLTDNKTYIYVCGLRGMEEGVEKTFNSIAESVGTSWAELRDTMLEQGRYHVETY